MTTPLTPSTAEETRFASSVSRLLWFFPPALLLHFVEEFGGVGSSIRLSVPKFIGLCCFAFLSMSLLIFISQRLNFPQFVQVSLGTVFLANAAGHIYKTALLAKYNEGVVTGVLILVPLGLLSIYGLRGSMNRTRYACALGLGLLMQVVTYLLSHSAG
jgi:hypothetical protein